MRKIFLSISLFIFFIFVFICEIFAWDNVITHRDISKYAAENSVLSKNKGDYLKNLGFNKELLEEFKWGETKRTVNGWLQDGAELEDAQDPLFPLYGTTRSYNHFHNPLKPWDQAGLNDTWTGKSSILWAQDGVYQQNFPGGDWSWQKIRLAYYYALTSRTEENRQAFFAGTFNGLGHQMHLIQDTAIPDHVRNDAHPEDAIFGKNILNGSRYFETWAKEEYRRINSLAANPVFPNVVFNISYSGLSPVTQLYDSEEYNETNPSTSLTQGLAEYTNANFFSGDTAFAFERYSSSHRHYFPYPRRSSTDLHLLIAGTKPTETIIDEDGNSDTGTWVSKISDGEIVGHFLRASSLTQITYKLFGEGNLYYRTFYRDETAHEDYAQKLIPRAVGYSAGLLNYFFRGTLEISAPDSYVYSIIDGSQVPQQFTKIKAKVKNATLNEEIQGCDVEKQNCILRAVVRYKKRIDYQPDLSTDPPTAASREPDYSYSVSSPITLTADDATALNSSAGKDFAFDFTESPIPSGITDLYLQVVFKGTLGNETDIAVAVGMKDLMEPTHHIFWNLTDMFSLDGHLYTAEQIRANPQLLSRVGSAFIDKHDINFEISYMGESPPSSLPVEVAAATLPAARHMRLIILVDNKQAYNYVRIKWSSVPYPNEKYGDKTFQGATNQEVNGSWQSAPIDVFRTVKGHFSQGVLVCVPHYEEGCPYPEEEAIPVADLTPYPVTIYFPEGILTAGTLDYQQALSVQGNVGAGIGQREGLMFIKE